MSADDGKEIQAREWVASVVGRELTTDTLHAQLKSGTLLCALLNGIHEGIVPARSINAAGIALKEQLNITTFLQNARALGVREFELFSTPDLYQNKNMRQVVTCLLALQREIGKESGVRKAADLAAANNAGAKPASAASAPTITTHAQMHRQAQQPAPVLGNASTRTGFVPFSGASTDTSSGAVGSAVAPATHTQATAGTAPPVSEREMASALERLPRMHTDDDRLRLIRALASNFSFTSGQLAQLIEIAHFGGGGVEAAALIWPQVSDRGEVGMQRVLKAFKFEDERSAARSRLQALDAAPAATAPSTPYYEVGTSSGSGGAKAPWSTATAGGPGAPAHAGATAAAAPPLAAPAPVAAFAAAAAGAGVSSGGGGSGGWSWSKNKQ